MKSKEEILEKHAVYLGWEGSEEMLQLVKEAMEEYASQFKSGERREQKEEAYKRSFNSREERQAFQDGVEWAESQWQDKEEWGLSDAIKLLGECLKSDEAYFHGWQSNVAIAFHDEFKSLIESGEIEAKFQNSFTFHDCCNNAAKRFLNLLLTSPS